jgi:hypothetical protein
VQTTRLEIAGHADRAGKQPRQAARTCSAADTLDSMPPACRAPLVRLHKNPPRWRGAETRSPMTCQSICKGAQLGVAVGHTLGHLTNHFPAGLELGLCRRGTQHGMVKTTRPLGSPGHAHVFPPSSDSDRVAPTAAAAGAGVCCTGAYGAKRRGTATATETQETQDTHTHTQCAARQGGQGAPGGPLALPAPHLGWLCGGHPSQIGRGCPPFLRTW